MGYQVFSQIAAPEVKSPEVKSINVVIRFDQHSSSSRWFAETDQAGVWIRLAGRVDIFIWRGEFSR